VLDSNLHSQLYGLVSLITNFPGAGQLVMGWAKASGWAEGRQVRFAEAIESLRIAEFVNYSGQILFYGVQIVRKCCCIGSTDKNKKDRWTKTILPYKKFEKYGHFWSFLPF